ncbi:MAG: hypothetical protein ABJP45_15835 [Cyclobacteriaceae bacterium]
MKFNFSTKHIYTLHWDQLYWVRFEFQNSIESLGNLAKNVSPNMTKDLKAIKDKCALEIKSLKESGEEDYAIHLENEFYENIHYVLHPMTSLSYQSIFVTAYALLESNLKKLVEFTWKSVDAQPKQISKRDLVGSYSRELNSLSSVRAQDIAGYSEIQSLYKEVRNRFTHEMGYFEKDNKIIIEAEGVYEGLKIDIKSSTISIVNEAFVLDFLRKCNSFYSKLIEDHDKAFHEG